MREQGHGHMVNIGSLASEIVLPFQSVYSASKAAVRAMTRGLSMEVKPFGIRVVLIEPSNCRTQVADYRRWTRDSDGDSAYLERCRRSLAVAETDECNGMPPDRVARTIERVINARSPRLYYLVAPPFDRFAAAAGKVAPGRLFEWFHMKYYRIG
jgi:short-subunit dehydrogenase